MTGRSVVRPRGFELSASGIVLSPPRLGEQKGLARAFFAKGLRALGRNDLPVALDSFSRSSLDAPEDPEPWYGAAYVSFELQQDDAALKAARRALELQPSHPMASLVVAWLEQRAGRIDEARTHYGLYLGSPIPAYAPEVSAILSQLSASP